MRTGADYFVRPTEPAQRRYEALDLPVPWWGDARSAAAPQHGEPQPDYLNNPSRGSRLGCDVGTFGPVGGECSGRSLILWDGRFAGRRRCEPLPCSICHRAG
jgi:hypothetical protein